MKIKLFLSIILIAVLASACTLQIGDLEVQGIDPTGVQVTEVRPAQDFTRVVMAGVGRLEITQGSEEKLVVEADEAFMPHLITRVENGTLFLGETKPGTIFTNMENITYTLTVKTLEGISLSGLGDVQAKPLTAERMEIQVSGSGNVEIEDLQAETLTVQISGLGSATVAGKVTRQEVSISGSGDYDAPDLESEEMTATISGLGGMYVWVKTTLKATISGSGNITYFGSPTVTSDISGIGNLDPRGSK